MRINILIVLLLFFTACSVRRYPVLPQQKLGSEELSKAYQIIEKRNREISSLKLLSKTRLIYGEDLLVLKHAILAKRANFLRVDTLPQTGAFTLGILVANPEGVTYLDVPQKEAFFSADQVSLVRKALGVPLDAAEVFSFLLARIPIQALQQGLRDNLIEGYRAEDGDVILAWKNQRYYWKLNLETGLLNEMQQFDAYSGKLVLTMYYANFFKQGNLQVPRNISFVLEKDDVNAQLLFTSLTLNSDVSDDKFQLTTPPDFKIHRLR